MKTDHFEDILIYFSESLLGKENEDEILWDLAKNCIAKLGFVDCVVYLILEDRELLVQKAAYGPKNPKDHKLYNPVEIVLGHGITGSVAVSGKAEIIPDTSKDPRYIVDDDNRLSEICVPISHEDVIYGVIDCEHPEKEFFTNHHLKMLSAIASICAIKIKSVRAQRALREKQEKLLQIKEEMIELRLKALNSQLNPHFVFNSLNAIQYYVTSEDKKSTLEYLSTFSKLIRFNLKYLGAEVVELKEELKMLGWYLKLQKLRYDQFDYTLNIEDPVGKWDALIPTALSQSLLENIIENTMPQAPKGHLLVNFKVSKTTVILETHCSQWGTNALADPKPQYEEQNAQLLDQIRLLNANKGYGIDKEVYLDSESSARITMLTLPNLFSMDA
ncbi:histidine kinase [Flagellimonas myxillae]|uniref:histidine kinase n=1 Tax=Flagellimonas myxillae TaxID=2942214 RepID=UPI00201EB800|nr:histidine kinase [Muricauda myxillae]MCL6266698.1 histidine kinase [Muricauda myxillae]